MMRSNAVKFIVIGALAGIANGFFGAGGGMFLVPLYIYWCKIEERTAFATSVAVILPMSIVSLWAYYKAGQIEFMSAIPYIIGGIIGGVLSGKLFPKLKILWLRRAFGALIVYGGIRAIIGG